MPIVCCRSSFNWRKENPTLRTEKNGRSTELSRAAGGGAMMKNPIYVYVLGALIIIATLTPLALMIIDKAGF